MCAHPQPPGITGTVVHRGGGGYEEARAKALWNDLKPERHPEVIVRAASESDVVAAVGWARERGLRIAVRSGGHSWCGSPLRDGGLLLDLSALRRCEIDAASATARVQPGLTGGELTRALAREGLAFPTGHCGSVALGGYLLSGGLGWNSRHWGVACAGVRRIEAVTADARTVVCDAEQNPELFWAAKGAGPGFPAVVTAFHLALRPRRAALAATTQVFPLEAVEAVVRWAVSASAELPSLVEPTLVLGTATGDPAGPRTVMVTATAFADSPEEAARALAPLRTCPLTERPLARDADLPTSLDALYAGSAEVWPEGLRYAADTLWSSADHPTLLTRLGEAIAEAPSPRSLVLAPVTPVSREEGLTADMAFSVLGESYAVPYAVWEDSRDDDRNVRWLRRTVEAVEPLTTGHYIAEADLTADPSRARRCFAPADWERLRRVRAAWDPQGAFHSYLSG
ncbi:FAD-binding oxidoreductase [Peterkaempfera griseoplana]|uniref:FAD-binding oxidoreductase n=1 Tax=Peterkaempfera griseoplana TaxID=66896 RepID=UPI0006E1E1B0|nr:FAD-binding oxidoreductase [Peterkaempfera griseoplana]